MIFDGEGDALTGGHPYRLFEPAAENPELRLVRITDEAEAAADHPHHRRADSLGMMDMADHVVLGLSIPARLEAVRMAPRIDAIKAVGIEPDPHVGEVAGIETWKEARLERDSLAAKFVGPIDHPIHREGRGRWLLLRVDVAEEPMVAVAVDADFHGLRFPGDGFRDFRTLAPRMLVQRRRET